MESLFEQFGLEFDKLLSKFTLPLNEKDNILIFSLLLFIILLSPILLRKLKIPSLIGLIIAGVIIGPKGLNVISKENMETGFMAMFSKFGLLYIMFMAGLELDMQDFKRFRNKSITFGALTFFIPLISGYFVCRYGIGLQPLGSFLTASMFSTHTLVAYPIVSKYGISKIESVAIAIGGTIITDTAVLIMLPVIISAKAGDVNTNILIHMIIMLSFFSFIMFFIIPKIARWFLSKLASEKSSQYIFVLSVLFFASFLADASGIESIIGAFVAGLVLNRLIPHNSTLMNRIEFIGSSLFIPFFLMFIGMVVDVRSMIKGFEPWRVAVILTAFAIVCKFVAAWVTQLIFKQTRNERQLIFGLTSAHAAATLAIIKIGSENKILGETVLNGTVILILITSMVASFVTENAAKKTVISDAKNEPLEEPSMRSQHVLVAANELKGNEQLLDFSVLITDKKIKNPISVVSVLENDHEAEANIRRSRKHMDDFISHFNSGEINVQALATIDTNFSSGVARVSKEMAADIVLINDNSNLNILKRVVGDDREHLLDACERTVFFCHFEHSFSFYKAITLVCPPMAELESGCNQWLERVFRMTKALNCDMIVHCTRETFEKIKAYRTSQKYMADLTHFETSSYEEMLEAAISVKQNHLLFMVNARQRSVSAFTGMELLPQRIDKEKADLDRIFVYPSQTMGETIFTSYEDMNASTLAAGVETIQKIGKDIGGLFKK